MPELFLPGPADIAVAFGAYIGKGQIWNLRFCGILFLLMAILVAMAVMGIRLPTW